MRSPPLEGFETWPGWSHELLGLFANLALVWTGGWTRDLLRSLYVSTLSHIPHSYSACPSESLIIVVHIPKTAYNSSLFSVVQSSDLADRISKIGSSFHQLHKALASTWLLFKSVLQCDVGFQICHHPPAVVCWWQRHFSEVAQPQWQCSCHLLDLYFCT